MPLYDYSCDDCGKVQELHRTVDDRQRPALCECGKPAHLAILQVPPFILGQGRTHSGVVEWKEREKARLTKRSLAHDKSPRGKADREAALHRQMKHGNI